LRTNRRPTTKRREPHHPAAARVAARRLEIPPAYLARVRPASRKFRRELDIKVERLQARIAEFEGSGLAKDQNPGYDRLSEALFLRGEWPTAKRFAVRAAAHWEKALAAAPSDPLRCEPIFHLGSAYLFADDLERAKAVFTDAVSLYVKHGMAGSDDTGYMAVAAGDLRRAEVIFHAAVVADMGAQGMGDLKLFSKRFPDTPRLLKMQFAQGLAKKDKALITAMHLMERWLNPEVEGITSFRTEEWFFAAHQVVLAQLARGETPRFRLYDDDVEPGLVASRPA
jgi:hypothetical protein